MGRDNHPSMAVWQRRMLKSLGASDEEVNWMEEFLFDPPDDVGSGSMEVKSFGPSMVSQTPVLIRPETDDIIQKVWGRRAYRELAVRVIYVLMAPWGWPAQI